MKTRFLRLTLTLLSLIFIASSLSAQSHVRKAEKLTEKGFVDKKSIFDPIVLDSLLKCDEYVMLISSFDGCIPCEWLRTSDVFDIYPVTPYYTDFMLYKENETVPYTFYISGFPTCMFFNSDGEIIATTVGMTSYYDKLDKIIKEKENLCEHEIKGIEKEQLLPFFNLMYKANAAYLSGDMKSMYDNALEAMKIHEYFYNRYLLHKYYEAEGDSAKADEYKKLALDNADRRDNFIFKKLIAELKGEQTE